VGFGVDLAQWMASNLKSWGVSAAGQIAAAPYLASGPGAFGPQGPAAATLLAKNGPLNLSAADASAMTNGAFATISGRAASSFSSLTGGSNFLDLPSAVQTALVDVEYNTGSFTSSALPSGFSTAIQNMDWSQAAALLQQSTNPRFAQDGTMIAGAIQNKTLPATGAICR